MKTKQLTPKTITLRNNMDVATRHTHTLRDDGIGERISRNHYLAEPALRPGELAFREAACHPRGTIYRAPADARAVAMALEHPRHSICGLSAVAVYGLRFFADCCDTTLHGLVKRTVEATQFTPRITRVAWTRTWTVFFQNHPFLVSEPALAVAEAITEIRSRVHMWAVPQIDGWSPEEIRTIQLLDAVRRFFGLECREIVKASKSRVNQRWMQKVIRHSSVLADSPKETEMRLLCASVCAGLGIKLSEQVLLIAGGKIVTVFDLAIEELKIGIMYDGEHHLQRKQRDRDSRINVESSLQGWVIIRVTAGTLASSASYLKRMIEMRR